MTCQVKIIANLVGKRLLLYYAVVSYVVIKCMGYYNQFRVDEKLLGNRPKLLYKQE